MSKYAVIVGGQCVNIALWDGVSPWPLPPSATVAPYDPAVHVLTPPADVQNARTLRQSLILGAAADLAFINAAKPGTAALQASAAYDAAVRCSRQLRSLILLEIAEDTTDISGT